MRRRKLLAAVVGLAVLVAVGVFALWPQAGRVTRENYQRIRIGMTLAEVETILGPPGDYRSGRGETDYGGDDGPAYWQVDPEPYPKPLVWGNTHWSTKEGDSWPSRKGRWGVWVSDSAIISVIVDDAEHVVEMYASNRRMTQSFFDNLLWRAKRQWRRWFPE
jgi:hypothetical protein